MVAAPGSSFGGRKIVGVRISPPVPSQIAIITEDTNMTDFTANEMLDALQAKDTELRKMFYTALADVFGESMAESLEKIPDPAGQVIFATSLAIIRSNTLDKFESLDKDFDRKEFCKQAGRALGRESLKRIEAGTLPQFDDDMIAAFKTMAEGGDMTVQQEKARADLAAGIRQSMETAKQATGAHPFAPPASTVH